MPSFDVASSTKARALEMFNGLGLIYDPTFLDKWPFQKSCSGLSRFKYRKAVDSVSEPDNCPKCLITRNV